MSELSPAAAREIGEAIAVGIAANAPPKKVSFGEYARKISIGRPKLQREFWLCGRPSTQEMMTSDQIRLVNQITHSGRYFDRLVEVIVRQEGSDELVEIRWPCRTTDQRMVHATTCGNLLHTLQGIVKAQAEERMEEETRPTPPPTQQQMEIRRHFGQSKATKEAFARVAAAEAAEAATTKE